MTHIAIAGGGGAPPAGGGRGTAQAARPEGERQPLAQAPRASGFLEDGRLRDVLGVAAEPWRTMVRGLSSAPELGAWTGEIWCRLVLEGSPARTVEDELWR